jgi:formamidopyrimidine-DNA glycosylase
VAQAHLHVTGGVAQPLGRHAGSVEAAPDGGNMLVAAAVRGAAHGQRLLIERERLERSRGNQWLCLVGLGRRAQRGQPLGISVPRDEPAVGSRDGDMHLVAALLDASADGDHAHSAYRIGNMPELPELEAFVRAQRERLCASVIESVPVAHFATVKTIEPPIGTLAGMRFVDVRRRAKRLLFETDAGPVLMLHLMSAGRLSVGPARPKSAVLAIAFSDGVQLAMSEPGSKRRAGAWLLSPTQVQAELGHLGPEPIDPEFTVEALRAALDRHPHQLHAFLRDQRAIAGIGRAYANEILHAARLSPYARSSTLTDEQLARLHAAITGLLGEAVERLVPLSKSGLATKAARGYAVHDRAGEECPRCGNEIRYVSFDEHTLYYCPTCQTDGRVLADRRLSRLLRE